MQVAFRAGKKLKRQRKERKREIRLPFSACEAGKGNEKRGKGKLGCLSWLAKWEKATKKEEKVKLGCLSWLVKREKATKKEEKAKLGCLFPRHPGRRKSKSLQR